MNARELVQRHWREIAARHGCSADATQGVLEELVAAYAEPHRAYHTLDHIAALLRLFGEYGNDAMDGDAVALAIVFHDAVYDPARSDNEAASAGLAGERLAILGFAEALIAKVRRLILATQHGAHAGAVADADAALLLDLDLSVLGAPPEDYRAYAQAIRREFSIYPDAVYRPGRRRVLEGFLARDRIYLTGRLGALWEAPARRNIAGEIATLG